MERYVPLKTCHDVACVRRSCRIASETLQYLLGFVRPGVTTLELNALAAAFIRRRGARPGVKAGFPGSICISVNSQVAHGFPSGYALRDGDLLSLDVSVEKEGWYGDAAVSVLVGEGSEEARRLLAAGRNALAAGVAALRAGSRLGDVGAAIQAVAEQASCRVIEECVGHGIGRHLHEEPEVPHTGRAGEGRRIIPGMVLAVEPALTSGCGEIVMSEDGWTIMTADGAPAVQFEITAAVFRAKTQILTASPWSEIPGPDCELAGPPTLG
jgi:methionyl aminopeptidase